MKKITYLFIFMLVFSSLINAQVKENRKTGEFLKIEVSDGIDLELQQGENISVVAEAKDNDLLNSIITEVDGNTLKIYSKEKIHWVSNRKVYVTFKTIESIQANGGSDVSGEEINAGKLEMSASGGSDINLKVNAEELTCRASGGSDIFLSGKASKLDATANGGSDIKAGDFKTSTCNVHASGGSDVYLNASDELSVEANGGSDVYLSGDAKISNINTNGGSDLHRR